MGIILMTWKWKIDDRKYNAIAIEGNFCSNLFLDERKNVTKNWIAHKITCCSYRKTIRLIHKYLDEYDGFQYCTIMPPQFTQTTK